MDSKGMDPVLRYCAVGRQLGYAVYLSLDIVAYVSGHLAVLLSRESERCEKGLDDRSAVGRGDQATGWKLRADIRLRAILA